MFPYGFTHGLWRDEDGGPTTKHHNLSSKNRRTSRRLLHKSERAKVKQEIQKEKDGNSTM